MPLRGKISTVQRFNIHGRFRNLNLFQAGEHAALDFCEKVRNGSTIERQLWDRKSRSNKGCKPETLALEPQRTKSNWHTARAALGRLRFRRMNTEPENTSKKDWTSTASLTSLGCKTKNVEFKFEISGVPARVLNRRAVTGGPCGRTQGPKASLRGF